MGDASDMAAQIEDATERFVGVLAGVDGKAWTTAPEPSQWSLSEVLEHVTLSNRNLIVTLGALQTIASPPDVADEEMPYLFYQGAEPPNVAHPTGTWTDIDEAVGQLRASAGALVAWAGSTTVDPRSHGFPHPLFGMLDGAQWLRFSAVHTWRHRAELQAVRRWMGA